MKSVGSLAFGTQHYAPGRDQPLLCLAFNVDLGSSLVTGLRLLVRTIQLARFVPTAEAIELVLSAGVSPGSRVPAEFLRHGPGRGPTFSLWDLNEYRWTPRATACNVTELARPGPVKDRSPDTDTSMR